MSHVDFYERDISHVCFIYFPPCHISILTKDKIDVACQYMFNPLKLINISAIFGPISPLNSKFRNYVSCPAGGQNNGQSGGRKIYFSYHFFLFLLKNNVNF